MSETHAPSIDSHLEGSYRRGYHQAVAEIAHLLQQRNATADDLFAWVEGPGMTWRKDVTLAKKVTPPGFD